MPQPNKFEVGKRLQQIRLESNISMSELGKRIGNVDVSTIYKWLKGIALPPREIVEYIAFIFDTSINWIYWGVDTLDVDFCSSCDGPIVKGICKKCWQNRELEMIQLFDMLDSTLFPMTRERKSTILHIVDEEIQEIQRQLETIIEHK